MDADGANSETAAELCPWCEQPIPHERFEEIRARITAKERERSLEVAATLQADFAREQMEAEAAAKTRIELVQQEAATAMEAATQKAAADIEAAKSAAEVALAPKLAKAEQDKKAVEDQLEAVKATQDAALNQRLQEQREVLDAAQTAAVNAEKAKAFEEKLKLEEKLQQLQRQLQGKSAGELGEGAELDLFEALRGEFPDDQIKRIPKGVAGADIIQEVFDDRELCGRIVYDSKNRNAWRNDYVTKLRKDQIAAKADQAILTTQVFPAGARQLHNKDGVIVTNPARVVAIVQLLRRGIVHTHTLRLSNEERDEKMGSLYDFVTSDRCKQLFEQVEITSQDLLDLDVKEKRAHDATWKQRGELVRSTQRTHGDISAEIDRIVGGARSGSIVAL